MTYVPDLTDVHNRRHSYTIDVGSSNLSYEHSPVQFTPQSNVFEQEFERHRRAIRMGRMEEALQSFVLLQTNSAKNETFEAYIIKFSDHIDPTRNTDISIFFASLPALIQSTIIEKITCTLEKTDMLKAYQALFDYIQNYSRHAYKYLVRAIKLLVLGAQGASQSEREKYIRILVTELFLRLSKQRILLTHKDTQPSVKSTDGKQYILIPYNLFEQYLSLGQQYYIERREWSELTNFTDTMLDCCGYTRLGQIGFQSHLNKFQYLQEKRSSIRIDPDSKRRHELIVLTAFMCEFKAVAAEFIQLCNQYYRAVCSLDSIAGEEKSCLIPVCAIKPVLSSDISENQHHPTATTAIQPEVYCSSSSPSVEEDEDESVQFNNNNKRVHNMSALSKKRESISEENSHPLYLHHNNKRQKIDLPDRGGEGLSSYCMSGVDSALQILSKAADCMRHIVVLWEWATQTSPDVSWEESFGGWEEEFIRVIDAYQLPFDLTNAVLLVRSDIALSSPSIPGNLAKALKLSQAICDRIEIQRRRFKKEIDSAPPEFDIPFMFAFRILYNIGIIYLLVGSLPQSTLEIAIILSVFPIPSDLGDLDFLADEMDCKTVANIYQEHEFGLMRVTQEGLVARCIKHLIVSLNDDSSDDNSMASIHSALRWDEKAGQIIVLMQFGWNYWCTQTSYWHKIVTRMQDRKVFRNRGFLEFIYVPEILEAFQHLHNHTQVLLDIIPPEFAMRSGYRYFGENDQTTFSTQRMNLVSHITIEENPHLIKLPSLSSITSQSMIPSMYQPSRSDTILPSMSMSPTWYSPSTQKNSHVNWMSPSFYYSRPATSVMLQGKIEEKDNLASRKENRQEVTLSLPSDIIVRCLEYRVRKYSPKMTPQRMRQVLQRFLKNMLAKANEES